MAITGNCNRLLPSRLEAGSCPQPPARVLSDLAHLSDRNETISDLSRELFLRLQNFIGTDELNANLLALQYLAGQGETPGVRLLAAYLDMTTAGARLIPFLRNFNHTRRQLLFIKNVDGVLDEAAREWQSRSLRLISSCFCLPGLDKNISWTKDNPVPCLQAVLEKLLSEVISEVGVSPANRSLLAGLLQMETDAWQERISRLAGTVNPFRVSSVQKLLPMLNRADASIRDLRQLVAWVQEGQDRNAFTRHGPRALEVLDMNEYTAISKTLNSDPDLSLLADLHKGGRDNPSPLPWLGAAVASLLALDHQIVKREFETTDLDLMSAVDLVQKHVRGSILAIPLGQEQEAIIQSILNDPDDDQEMDSGRGAWSTSGLKVEAGQLVLTLQPFSEELTPWPNGLPCEADTDPGKPQFTKIDDASDEQESTEENAQDSDVLDATSIKSLVFSNITSTSVLLGFLRNPKVVAVPGLVGAVAARTRNPQIIETIASVRSLHSGFANRDVPLICLRSPCNVSPKVLRKFIHVKFVSKVDLRQMAADRSGMRKEVVREIEKYLKLLG